MQAVGGEFVGFGVVTDVACARGVGEDGADEVVQLSSWLGHLFVAVDECAELGAEPVPGHPVHDACVGRQHGVEPGAGVGGLFADGGELFEVRGDVAAVPGDQDRVDVGEVLVEGRAPDAGFLGDA